MAEVNDAVQKLPVDTPVNLQIVRQVMGRFNNRFFVPGQTLRVKLRLLKQGVGALNQLHLVELLPEGWTATLLSGADGAAVKSLASNAIVLDWTQATAFPLEIVYEAKAPDDAAGLQTVTGQADYQTEAGQNQSTGAIPSVIAEALPADMTHSADVNHDWRISLSEVLRVVQIYNAGEYSAMQGTEDGYNPGPGDRTGIPHDADLNGDWAIDMSELLRLVQLFNAPGGSYYVADTTEDGFVPGVF